MESVNTCSKFTESHRSFLQEVINKNYPSVVEDYVAVIGGGHAFGFASPKTIFSITVINCGISSLRNVFPTKDKHIDLRFISSNDFLLPCKNALIALRRVGQIVDTTNGVAHKSFGYMSSCNELVKDLLTPVSFIDTIAKQDKFMLVIYTKLLQNAISRGYVPRPGVPVSLDELIQQDKYSYSWPNLQRTLQSIANRHRRGEIIDLVNDRDIKTIVTTMVSPSL